MASVTLVFGTCICVCLYTWHIYIYIKKTYICWGGWRAQFVTFKKPWMFTQKQALQQDFICLNIFKASWFLPEKLVFVLTRWARPENCPGTGGVNNCSPKNKDSRSQLALHPTYLRHSCAQQEKRCRAGQLGKLAMTSQQRFTFLSFHSPSC